jgi:predicted phosphodiesterase
MALTNIDDRHIVEVVNHALTQGDNETCEVYNLRQESLARYKREYRKRFGDIERRATLEKIASQYTDKELQAIAAGGAGGLGTRRHVVERSGRHVKFGFLTDTHIGSIYFREELFDNILQTCREEGCEFLAHSGDVTEGMSNRPGHVYELSEIGFSAQKERASELLSRWDGPLYMIDGNHDRWFVKSAGAYIVEEVAKELPNAVFLGNDEGDIVLGNTVVKLWHGEDGSSYATSYRLQKLIESLSGGQKPHVLLAGHTHKQGYFFDRNIHVVSGGSVQLQSKWMRGKRIPAHTGFHIIDMELTDDGVTRFRPEWFPFFQ